MPRLRVLILGGTTEARALAAACVELPSVVTVSSLAGRTADPRKPTGEVRVGGFGGVPGLIRYLRDEGVGAVVDATHPFASTMTGHVVSAAGVTRTPYVVLRRPGWTAGPGDRWLRVPTLAAAAARVRERGSRVFLTTGRQGIAAFASVPDVWFLSRSVEPPEPPMPERMTVVLDRGPFTLVGERALMRGHGIDVLVTKDSGGEAPKLQAARELGIPVVMVDRPVGPPAPTVAAVAEALSWLDQVAVEAGAGGSRLGP
jgi:precorrin-6A/cobalt-precorrin-6A reductase